MTKAKLSLARSLTVAGTAQVRFVEEQRPLLFPVELHCQSGIASTNIENFIPLERYFFVRFVI